jgi:hypothetical protein
VREPEIGYRAVLGRVHEALNPRVYAEIGVHYGRSLILANQHTRCVGIDPSPTLEITLTPNMSVIEKTSDDFFAQETIASVAGAPADVSFIDGRHLFEYALRDFRNLERNSHPGSIILAHDCHPREVAWAERGVRSGDVWKLLIALRRYRPDLSITTIEAPPTGLALIRNLSPSSEVLWEKYDEILAEVGALRYTDVLSNPDFPVNPVPSTWSQVRELLPAQPYRSLTPSDRARLALRKGQRELRRQVKLQTTRWKRRAASHRLGTGSNKSA